MWHKPGRVWMHDCELELPERRCKWQSNRDHRRYRWHLLFYSNASSVSDYWQYLLQLWHYEVPTEFHHHYRGNQQSLSRRVESTR